MRFWRLAGIAALAAHAPPALAQAPAETMIAVETSLPDTPAIEMKGRITAKLEPHVRAAGGVRFSVSFTRDGYSLILLKFRPGIGGAGAEQDVRAQVARARPELPPAAGEPAVAVLAPEAKAAAYLAFSSDTHAPVEVSNYVGRNVRSAFDTVPGVSEVRVYGFHKEVFEIRLDPRRLAAYRVAPGDVEAALKAENIVVGGARKRDDAIILPIIDRWRITPERVRQLVVTTRGGAPVRVGDLGEASLGSQFDGTHVAFDGLPAVLVAVLGRPDGDTAALARHVRARVNAIEISRPGPMALRVGYACEVCAGLVPR